MEDGKWKMCNLELKEILIINFYSGSPEFFRTHDYLWSCGKLKI